MMLWTTLLCLFSANLVVSQFTAKPEILAGYDPGTTLQPPKGNLQDRVSSDHVIRGLLRRQTQCPIGYTGCSNAPGDCCPIGNFCYATGCCPNGTNGCGGNSCCIPGESCCSGGGCCDPGYYCVVVNGQRGCCLNGKTCTTGTPQCVTATYVLCPGENFCCPPGYTCSRDTSNNPQCNLPNNNSIPPTLTNTNPPNTNGPSGTYLGTTSSSTIPKGPSTASLPPKSSTTSSRSTSTSSPNPTPSSNNNGATSSAISVAVDAVFTFFAGVGVFAYLF